MKSRSPKLRVIAVLLLLALAVAFLTVWIFVPMMAA